MKTKILAGSLLLAAASGAAHAQAPQVAAAPVAPAAVAVVAPATGENVLRAGVEVPLITREELTTRTKQLRVGQRIQLAVAANVEQNGVVVIPAGTLAVGELTQVRNKGMWGKSGYVAARIVSLQLGERHIRLTGTFDDKGVTGTGGVVAAIAFVPVAGFFTTGTSAVIPNGSAVKGFLDEDIAFASVAATPAVAPAAVPAPAAGVVPAALTVPPQAAR